jgi:hypothetical protein
MPAQAGIQDAKASRLNMIRLWNTGHPPEPGIGLAEGETRSPVTTPA